MSERGEYSNRIYILALFFVVLGLALLGKLFWVQILRHDDLQRQLESRVTQTKFALTGRGDITDCQGRILAQDRPCYQLAVKPSELGLETGIVEEISYCLNQKARRYSPLFRSGILPTPVAELGEKLDRMQPRLMIEPLVLAVAKSSGVAPEELSAALVLALRNLLRRWYNATDRQVLEIFISAESARAMLQERERYPGFYCVESAIRCYPAGVQTAQVTGYIARLGEGEYKVLRALGSWRPEGFGEDVIRLNEVEAASLHWVRNFVIGKSGVELMCNEALRSRLNRIRQRRKFGNREQVFEEETASEGTDVALTIDLELQQAAGRAMGANRGAAVMVDLDTGGILISVSKPDFDPNRLSPPQSQPLLGEEAEGSPLINRVTNTAYPFGSIFKIVTATAALESGVINAATTFHCERKMPRFKNLRCLGSHGDIDLAHALQHSCNIFFFETALALGIDRLNHEADLFNLGVPLGSGYPYERGGVNPDPDYKLAHGGGKWYPGDTCNTAIGQGYQLGTPLQAAVVAGLISRPEGLRRPHYLADQTTGWMTLPVSPETRQVVNRGLWMTVNAPGGTAYGSRSSRVVFAGKTGTADVCSYESGHQLYRAPHAWFAGFAPADAPRVAVAVIVENSGHGGEAAAPVAKAMFDAWAGRYLKLASAR